MKRFVFLSVVLAAIATSAVAGEDNFQRQYTAGFSWSASSDQWVGLRFWQVREGLPGVWIEGKAGSDWKTGNGGITQRLGDNYALVLGGGVAFDGNDPDTDDGFNFHAGLMGDVWKIKVHIGYDTRPGSVAGGLGWTFW